MKNEQINLKLSPEEKRLLKKAARNLNAETGAKENISEAIRHSVKKYAETDLTKPECFFVDRPAIKEIDSCINVGLISLQKFLDEFKRITGENLNIPDLEVIFEAAGKLDSARIIQNAIAEMVHSKLYERLRRKYPDMMLIPENVPEADLTDLFEYADAVDSLPPVKNRQIIYWRCYSITGNVISVIPEKVEGVKDQYRFYATTPEELLKLQQVKKVCQALNELLSDSDAKANAEKLLTVVYFDRESWQFVPSGAWMKYKLAPEVRFVRPEPVIGTI